MEKLKALFTLNWISKLISLFIAIAIWFTIFSHLEKKKMELIPVPGTIPVPQQSTDPPANPLIVPNSVVPGN